MDVLTHLDPGNQTAFAIYQMEYKIGEQAKAKQGADDGAGTCPQLVYQSHGVVEPWSLGLLSTARPWP
jgi:hypothetical protein